MGMNAVIVRLSKHWAQYRTSRTPCVDKRNATVDES